MLDTVDVSFLTSTGLCTETGLAGFAGGAGGV
jgi:hypothetical protein